MTLCKLIVCGVSLVIFASLSMPGQSVSSNPSGKLQSGVVVEQALQGWSGDKAGIKEGDVILRWSRGTIGGDLASPYDVQHVETEQALRGVVTLEGLRGNEKQSWVMGANSWKVATRPQL